VQDQFETAKQLVEATIHRLGVDPAAVRGKDAADLATWSLQRGSAGILVTVSRRKEDAELYLRIVSPVIIIPKGEGGPDRREALFTRLLELNGSGLANCAFGLIGDRVVVVSERPVVGLDAEEVEQMVSHLGAVADTYDDRLVKEFGGKRASDKS
jgi:hypothetical protein